jgi:FixJ family two-component response regulator
MVTTHSNVDAVVSSIKAGCDGYIIKPFSDDKIRHTLQKVGLPPPGDEMGKTKSS